MPEGVLPLAGERARCISSFNLFNRFNSFNFGSERGVALVITLILLSVITFMAVTFLVVTRTEKGSVTTDADQATAKSVAEEAIEQAKMQIIAPMLAYTNPFVVNLMVSTNYIREGGFINSGLPYTSFTNVNYYYPNGSNVTGNAYLQNLENLRYLPRAPVFVTNKAAANSMIFPWYWDLNRNGRPDMNGLLPVIGNTPGKPYYDTNGVPMANIVPGNTMSNYMTGDPEWIGVLERPAFSLGLVPPIQQSGTQPFPFGYGHSPSNRFIGRYAFSIVPISLALDINAIHNYAKMLSPAGMKSPLGDGFRRNEEIGSFEINLAAFLADLNTNLWAPPTSPYQYDTSFPVFSGNRGAAFDDALHILRYRYNTNVSNLAPVGSVNAMWGPVGQTIFANDGVDGYVRGDLMTGLRPAVLNDRDTPATFWPGADNPSRYSDPQDFYDVSKTSDGSTPQNLTTRLLSAGTSNDWYNAYTFYRLISQIGTDSAPERNKINLNFMNVDAAGNVVPDMATNFIPWTNSVQFFTNAAIHMLGDAISDTNILFNGKIHIQIYPTNFYLPAVHRWLQVAANIYDATQTNRFPSVFRPLFYDTGPAGSNQVFVIGYEAVTNTDIIATGTAPLFHEVSDLRNRPIKTNDMVYGVPLVVGAKKGFPAFNQLAMETDVRVTRKLNFTWVSANTLQTNQQFVMTVSNSFGVEAWNSYFTNYPGALQMQVAAEAIMGITNELGPVIGPNGGLLIGQTPAGVISNVPALQWVGSGLTDKNPTGPNAAAPASFKVPIFTNYMFLTNSTYVSRQRRFYLNGVPVSDGPNRFPIPHWWLNITTRMRFVLVDTGVVPNRIIDYVNLEHGEDTLNITDLLRRPTPESSDDEATRVGMGGDVGGGSNLRASLFSTNRPNNVDVTCPTYGVINQIAIAQGTQLDYNSWNEFGHGDKNTETRKFSDRLNGLDPATIQFSAPYEPYRDINKYVNWTVNDPLVHYTVPDLTDLLTPSSTLKTLEMDRTPGTVSKSDAACLGNLGTRHPLGGRSQIALNVNYRPWGVNGSGREETSGGSTLKNTFVKDALIYRSDDWDFPTNKFPNRGWLGRVHRGSPWQTIFFKSTGPDPFATNTVLPNKDIWLRWSGHLLTNFFGPATALDDSIHSHPTNDYRIAGLFTTAFNDNASRGQLPINQPGLAAWSAVLSGLPAATSTTNSFRIIQPAGIYDPNRLLSNNWPDVVKIVEGINRTRTNNSGVFSNGAFQRLGDILSVPELSMSSPFLQNMPADVINDDVYERIPQQILSLLTDGSQPRFLIVASGQALKPAERSIMNNGPYFGLCTNYQVVAETTIRAVVRVDGSPDPAQANNPDPAKRYPPRVVLESYNVLGPY